MPRFNENLAAKAIQLVVNSLVRTAMDAKLVKREHLHIVVGKADGSTDGKVLSELSMGDPQEWEFGYRGVAHSKFKITARTGLPTRLVQTCMAELADEDGDTVYWGSAIDGGIIVACSGVEPFWDEAFSKAIAAVVRAMLSAEQESDLAAGKTTA